MSSTCLDMRIALGVYVLGAIDPAERSRLEAHLMDCRACRDELAGMAGLPALLGRVSEPQIELEDGELLESLLARAAAEHEHSPVPFRPRRRILLALSVAAALLIGVILGGALIGRDLPQDKEPAVAAEQISASDSVTHVGATVKLTPKSWGTALEVEVSGAQLNSGCQMIAVGADGRRDEVGSWTVVSSKGGYGYYASTQIGRTDLRAIKIVTTDGKDLVTVPVA